MIAVLHRAGPFSIACGVVLMLFWLMHGMVAAPQIDMPEGIEVIESVELVEVEKTNEQTPEQQQALLEAPPPPPPAAPPSMSTSDVPTVSVPTLPSAPIEAGPISIPISMGASGLNLGSTGSFGGFAGRGGGGGAGSGAGGKGLGTGKGFKGKDLVPLSTARPQMPEWACQQKLKGWVEVVFTVMPSGRVQDIKLVDANPRGVFEAAAVESISNWIYERTDKAREVKQRVPMNPEDCAFNY